MIETVKITIEGKTYEYNKNITLEEVLTEHQPSNRYPVLIARVNNRLRELTYTVKEDAEVEFLDLTTPEGLILVFLYAVNNIYGKDGKFRVEYSLDKGIYVRTKFKLNEDKLSDIKAAMKDIIKKDMPITRMNIDRLEARKYFLELGEESKAGVLRYNTDNYISNSEYDCYY